jgi:type II secretory pathway pseudopilin PulG
MQRGDIALTVGGVLATMVLAYLLYRLERGDRAKAQAQAAQSAADEATDAQYAATNYSPGLNAYQYDEVQPQAQTPLITGVTNNTTSTVTSSSNTSDLGSYIDSTSVNHLLSDVVAAFSGGGDVHPSFSPQELEALSVPAITGVAQTALSGVPVTAQDAAAQAMLAITPAITTASSSSAAFPDAMLSSIYVSSHPVQPHPITHTGS